MREKRLESTTAARHTFFLLNQSLVCLSPDRKNQNRYAAIWLLRQSPASLQSPVLPGIGSVIPGSLVSGEFTLGLIAQIRIWSAGMGLSNAFKSPSSASPNHLA